jgi:hypothetical protein
LSLAAFLTTVVRILDDAGIPFMLTGSLAAAFYGTPRSTQDVDIVIDPVPPQIDRLVDGLLSAGLYVSRDAAHTAFHTATQFNAIDPESGWKVDLILRKARSYSATEFGRRRQTQLLGVDVCLTSVEDLILAKLEWSQLGASELQRRDVVQLLESSWDSLDQDYLEQWIDNLGLQSIWQRARTEMEQGR